MYQVKYDEIGVKAFFKDYAKILGSTNFTGISYEVLKRLIASIDNIFPRLIEFPKEWTRNYYEIKIRGTLAYGTAFVFGRKLIAPAIRQLIVYSGHYIDQACADATLTGLPCTLGHLSDSVMEGAHKRTKQGEYLFTGGSAGNTGKEDYQKRVITQQFLNEWFRGAKASNTYKSSEHFN